MLIGVRAVALAVTPHVTSFLAGTRPVIKVSEIGRSRAHDRRVEIDHRPIRARSASDHAVRIVAGRAAVAHVGTMRSDIVNTR